MSSTQRQASDVAMHCIQAPVHKMEENRTVVEETHGLRVSFVRDCFSANVAFAVTIVVVVAVVVAVTVAVAVIVVVVVVVVVVAVVVVFVVVVAVVVAVVVV